MAILSGSASRGGSGARVLLAVLWGNKRRVNNCPYNTVQWADQDRGAKCNFCLGQPFEIRCNYLRRASVRRRNPKASAYIYGGLEVAPEPLGA